MAITIAEKKRQKIYREQNKERINARKRQLVVELKIEILNQYGGLVCRCGENRIKAIGIDHIDGGGKQHRVIIGSDLYRWLRRNNYPTGFRVLCSNCNILAYLSNPTIYSQSPNAIKLRKRYTKAKETIMAALGGKCCVCSEDDIRILTVHHINGDGANHRRRISKGMGGYFFYRAILKSSDYVGLECRCFSCNDAG